MKTLLLVLLLMQRRTEMFPREGARIDADQEARAAGKLLLENATVRVFEEDVPKGM